MNTKRTMRVAALIALALAPARAALGADFTFNVPVRVSNLSEEVGKICVVCEVNDGNVGDAYKCAPVGADGNFIGTVKVEVSSENRDIANRYNCELKLTKGTQYVQEHPHNGAAVAKWRNYKPGAKLEVTGPIN